MNKKRISAAFLAVVMAFSVTTAYAAPKTAPAKDLVIRDDVVLKDKTIEGSIIVADEAEDVILKNVVVNGSLIAREEVENLVLHNSRIDGGIVVEDELTFSGNTDLITLTDEAELTIRKGTVQKIMVAEDAEESEITVCKGAVVSEVCIDAEEVSVSGKGTVDVIYVNADEAEIDVPNAKVIVSEDAEDVEAGGVELEPGDAVIINPNGHGVTPFDPEPEVPEVPETPEAQLVSSAQIVDLGWSRFLAVAFTEGNSLRNCTLTVDGVDVTAAAANVTDDGSVVKWEITSLDHGTLVVATEAEHQTVALGGKGAAPVVTEGQTPDYFLMNGPVYVWDYHLTNYDEAGNIRYTPAKTTFAVDGVSSASIAHYSPDAVLHHDDKALPYFVTGEVQLMFNYAQGTEAEKHFVDGITDVDLVAFNEYNNTLNDQLHYELDKAFVHGDHTVACIKVPLGQENFTSNGRYSLRVTSNGVAKLFPIHVVEEVVPTMTVTGDTGYYGNEVHLRIADMTYGITRPIYRVDLTDPYGKTETLVKFDDWFLHGDLLVLYNTITNHFTETGAYTVKVWADGFQPFSHTFWQTAITDVEAPVEAVAAAETEAVPFDAISTASVGGGGSEGGGSGEGDSKVMNANLIVDADLMVNAKILVALGAANDFAAGIAERWDTMTKLYAFNQGAESVYDYDAFCGAYNAAAASGEYLTFAEYIASADAVVTPNRPYSVKQVLEDNLLGETTGFIEAVGHAVPAYTVEVVDGKAVITFADEAYLAAAAQGQLTLNGNSLPLQADEDFTIAGKVLTLNKVDYGKNVLSIRTDAYQTARVAIDRVYPVEDVQLSAADVTKGEQIVVKCTANHENGVCDFLAHVTGVQLIAPNGCRDDVMPDGAESVFDEIGYTISTMPNALIIGKDTLSQDCFLNEDGTFAAGEYKIVITAEYYGDQTVTVNVADAEIEGTNAAPTVAGVEHFQTIMDNYDRVSFMEEDVAAYLKAITSITLNGDAAKKVTNLWGETNAYKFSNDPAFGGADKFIDFSADCFADKTVTVVIKAAGYEDLTFTVVNGKYEVVLAAAPVVSGIVREGSVPAYDRISFEGDVSEYLPAITSVTLNGVEAKKVTNLWNETKAYKFSNDPAFGGADKFIDFTTDCFAGEVTLVIKAAGYEDLTLTLVDGALVVPTLAAPVVADVTEAGSIITGKTYKVSFETYEGIKTYLENITSITLNGEAAKKVTNLQSETKAYKLSVVDGSQSLFDYDAIEFTTDCFVGKVEVVVTAEGYEPLTFTVVDGQLQGNEPQLPAAPAVKDITYKTQFMGGNYYTVAFEGTEKEAAAFVAAINNITVNGQKVKAVASFYNDTLSYKPSADPAYGGAEQFVDFTEDCFKGEAKVVISADGYADLTFTVVDGKLA